MRGTSKPAVRVVAALLGYVVLFAAAPASGGEIESVRVWRDGGRYLSSIRAGIDAPPAAVFAAMTDYSHLARLNPAVRKSRIVASWSEHHHRVYTETRLCVLWFCATLGQTQDMIGRPVDSLEATLVPHTGHFSEGHARWRFEAGPPGTTRLRFDSELVPAFWMPPGLNVWMLRHMMVREAERTIEGLETVYRSEVAAEPGTAAQPKNQ